MGSVRYLGTLLTVLAGLCLLLIILSYKLPLKTVTLANGAMLKSIPCWFALPQNTQIKIHCAYYISPIEKKNQRHRFHLPVVYFQVNPARRSPDPILYISGGPGYAVGLNSPAVYTWLDWINEMKWQRDMVFFDQRGVGQAKPSLHCPDIDSKSIHNLQSSLSAEQDAAFWQNLAKQCSQAMHKQQIELDLITTEHSVNDIINLMQLFRTKTWNIYAVSYGTRVALELMKRKSGNLRAVMLDSIYPQNKHDLLVVPNLMHNAFRQLYAECRLSYLCQQKIPNLKVKTEALIRQFNKTPHFINVRSVFHPKKIRVYVNGYRLSWAIYQSMYSWRMIQKLPKIITSAYEGNPQALLPIIRKYADSTLDPLFSVPAFYSVECTDRKYNITESDFNKQIATYPDVQAHTLYHWKYDICRVWPVKKTKESFFELTRSAVPTLILNGELDPVTPWYWAVESSKVLDKHYTYIVKGIGHAVVDSDVCASKTVKQFLDQPGKRPTLACQQLWNRTEFKFEGNPKKKSPR